MALSQWPSHSRSNKSSRNKSQQGHSPPARPPTQTPRGPRTGFSQTQIRSKFWTNGLKWISLINTIVTLMKLLFILTLFILTKRPNNEMNLLKYISIQNTLAA